MSGIPIKTFLIKKWRFVNNGKVKKKIIWATYKDRKDLKLIMKKVFMGKMIQKFAKTSFINIPKIDLKKGIKRGKLKIVLNISELPKNTNRNSTFISWMYWKGLKLNEIFKSIKCTKSKKNPKIKTNPCKIGSAKYKLFYAKARDISDYIIKLNENKISMKDHNDIFDIISKWDYFQNHNMDVPLLHFK